MKLLKNIAYLYSRLNRRQALKMLNDAEGRAALATGQGMQTFIETTTKMSAVFGMAITAASLIGLAMTPIGWIVVGSAFLAGVLGFSIYKVYSAHQDIKKLINNINEISAKKLELAALGLFDELEKLEAIEKMHLDFVKQHNINATSQKLALEEIDRKSMTVYDGLKIGANIVTYPFLWIAKKTKLIKSRSDASTGVVSFVELVTPAIIKVREFIKFYSITMAVVSGGLFLAAHIAGINIASMGAVAAFTALTGLSGPIGLGIVLGAALIIASILLVNKVFFADPLNQLIDEQELAAKILPTQEQLEDKIVLTNTNIKRLQAAMKKHIDGMGVTIDSAIVAPAADTVVTTTTDVTVDATVPMATMTPLVDAAVQTKAVSTDVAVQPMQAIVMSDAATQTKPELDVKALRKELAQALLRAQQAEEQLSAVIPQPSMGSTKPATYIDLSTKNDEAEVVVPGTITNGAPKNDVAVLRMYTHTNPGTKSVVNQDTNPGTVIEFVCGVGSDKVALAMR